MQNRFTQPAKILTADATTFSAVIKVRGDRNFHAAITSKAGYKVSVPGITAATEEALMSALQKLDDSVKFYKKNATNEATEARQSKDLALLEQMRVDPKTNDGAYRNACRRFGQMPQVRPDFTGTQARAAVTPVMQQADELVAFEAAHPEIGFGGFLASNNANIMQYLRDFNLECTLVNLEQALADLTHAGMIRTSSTGKLNGAIYSKYDAAVLDKLRRNPAPAAQNAPEGLSDADSMAWQAVHNDYPTLDTKSPVFKRKCSDQLITWARQRAIESDQSLAADEKRPEREQKMSEILTGWARAGNRNLGTGNKAARDMRLWLG